MANTKTLGITLDGTEYIVTVREIKKDITEHITGIDPTEYNCTGRELKPTVLDDGTVTLNTDYTVAYTNNIWPGTGTVTITGTNDYEGEISFEFTINALDITTRITGIDPTTATYTGQEIKPTVLTDGSVVLDTDYSVAYSNNINPGTGVVTVTGINRYTGTVTYNFEIVSKASIEGHITGVSAEKNLYTGSEVKPTITNDGTVTLNTDYTVTYENNIEIGIGKAIVTGCGNYQGSKTVTFKIVSDLAKDVIAAHVTGIDPTTATYTGEEIKPTVTNDGSVVVDTDYTVSYSDNIKIGTGKVTVTGKGNYEGTVEYEFPITAADIADHIVGIDPTTSAYTGEEIEPTVVDDETVTKDTDYEVEYSDNEDVGTGKVTVTGKGNYTGSETFEFTITALSIKDHVTGIDPTTATYTGEEIKPTVLDDGTVTLDEDYTVSYSNNKEVGTGQVTVVGIGNYTDRVEYEFTIKEA